MNYNQPGREKREELRTYADLGLKRTLKSRTQRRRILERGAQLILGTGQPGEPELLVRRDHYQQVRAGVLSRLLRSARDAGWDFPIESLQDHLRPKVERETYLQILSESLRGARLESAFVQTHQRPPSKDEQRLFKSAHPINDSEQEAADQWRQDILGNVLGAIDDQRKNSSGRLQSIWADVDGTDVAQQSFLEKVEGGIAWFRCFNSALSYQLQRRPQLPSELGKKLGLPVKQLRVSY